jgi:hypothetical protein
VARLRGASVARLALVVVGVIGLAWAVILPASECKKLSADYGVCADNSALKWELAIAGAILVVSPWSPTWSPDGGTFLPPSEHYPGYFAHPRPSRPTVATAVAEVAFGSWPTSRRS